MPQPGHAKGWEIVLYRTDRAGDFSDDANTPWCSELITKDGDFLLLGNPVQHCDLQEIKGYSLK